MNVTNIFTAIISKCEERILSWIGGPATLSIQLDLTNHCNLHCKHCYHSNHLENDPLALESWLDIINQYQRLLKKLKLKPRILFCGGEPLLSPIFYALVEEVYKRWNDITILVLTNGTLISSHIDILKRYNLEFQISLEGPTERDHDSIRGNGNFKKSIEGIKILRKNFFDVHVASILTARTSTSIEEMFQLCSQLKVNSLNYTRFIPLGEGQKYLELLNDSEVVKTSLKLAMESIILNSKKYGVKTNTDKPLFCLLDKRLGQTGKFGHQALVVNYKGELKVSSRSDIILGNLLGGNLEKIFLSNDILQKLRKNRIERCEKCPHVRRCGGDRNFAYAKTGNILGPDDGCWLT